MTLADDLHATAVTAAAAGIASVLPRVPRDDVLRAAEAAVDAAAPFLDGTELRRVQEADSGRTVAP